MSHTIIELDTHTTHRVLGGLMSHTTLELDTHTSHRVCITYINNKARKQREN